MIFICVYLKVFSENNAQIRQRKFALRREYNYLIVAYIYKSKTVLFEVSCSVQIFFTCNAGPSF